MWNGRGLRRTVIGRPRGVDTVGQPTGFDVASREDVQARMTTRRCWRILRMLVVPNHERLQHGEMKAATPSCAAQWASSR